MSMVLAWRALLRALVAALRRLPLMPAATSIAPASRHA